jgi:hypothetical protein
MHANTRSRHTDARSPAAPPRLDGGVKVAMAAAEAVAAIMVARSAPRAVDLTEAAARAVEAAEALMAPETVVRMRDLYPTWRVPVPRVIRGGLSPAGAL